MSSLLSSLTLLFEEATRKAFPSIFLDDPSFSLDLTLATQEKFGHYQCNSALKLSKTLKLPPRQIAETLIGNIQDPHRMIEKLEVAGAGFINIFLTPPFLSAETDRLLRSSHLGILPPEKSERIIIDFSSPNVAKEMHVGHLRSTIIGDCLARLFEFLGYDVLRLNHIGDFGTSFGMLIAYMKELAPSALEKNSTVELSQLVEWYKASKKRFDEDPAFKKTAQLEVVALQQGEEKAKFAWEIICDISRKAYQEIYDLLGVQLIERGESFYNPYLADLVADLEAKGLITLSDGAKCIFLEGFLNREQEPLPLMVQKSDGGYNYDTTDMAAIHHRIFEEKGTRLIYVTDAGQSTHFQMIFKAAEKAGYLDPSKVRVDHVPFGLVLGSDGKKFRTRSGETEKLSDLLYTAVEKAEEILRERAPAIPGEERKNMAKALGIGAVKYADLSTHRLSDYTFSYERMLRFEGNTAAFLMYAYVRILGIKKKVQKSLPVILKTDHIELVHPSELALGFHLLRFHEVLIFVAADLLPNRLTDYLYTLAEKFNAFFRDCRVEGSLEENSRLLLCEATAKVLKQGLDILGIEEVERM